MTKRNNTVLPKNEKMLLSYIRKFLRKKIIKLEKINFITNKKKSKNQVGK
jgi:hypothetical protein